MASDAEYVGTRIENSLLSDKKDRLIPRIRSNIRGMRFGLIEFSGSLGDLGTFIPLTAAMSALTGMDIGAILIFAGLFNISTGFLFGLPIPVQPMKAIAAVAIAGNLLPAEIAAAGISAGIVILLLGMTGLVERVEKLIPRAIVRGIQLGVGLKLAFKGIQFLGEQEMAGADGLLIAAALGLIVLLFSFGKRFPGALLLFFSGLVILALESSFILEGLHIELATLSFALPTISDWMNGSLYGALPQLPLTLLNSVIAVCALSGDLFPGRKVSTTSMARSVGLMNLIGCWFGAMPMCHGSGGLAGQYRFGARTGGSVLMLGTMKLVAGLFFGAAAMTLLQIYPRSILGIMLIFAGFELAKPSLDQIKSKMFAVCVVTALGILLFNTLIGFVLGLLVAFVMRYIMKIDE